MEEMLEKYESAYLKCNDYDDYEEDSQDFEETPEEIQSINLLADLNIDKIEDFRLDSLILAEYYINLFFQDRQPHDIKINKSSLLTKEKIYTVINTSIISAVKKSYDALNNFIIITQEDVNKAKKNGDVTEEIKLVNETLKSLHQSGVPQQFAGGMMILYLEYCRGINFGT